MQDYPNIELIISDDCSTRGFFVDDIRHYIEVNQRNNIANLIIRTNDMNIGTVRHLELIREVSSGDIELSIASDDIWTVDTVFSDFIKAFQDNPEAECVMSQVLMCDNNMKTAEDSDCFVPQHVIALIQLQDYPALINEEAINCCLPGLGTAYRRRVFEKIGKLSDEYFLVEDFPTHMRLLSKQIPFVWLDQITAKHRAGGISHGNHRAGIMHEAKYVNDLVNAYEIEIIPNKRFISEENRKIAEANYSYHKKRLIFLNYLIEHPILHFAKTLFSKCKKMKFLFNSSLTNIFRDTSRIVVFVSLYYLLGQYGQQLNLLRIVIFIFGCGEVTITSTKIAYYILRRVRSNEL